LINEHHCNILGGREQEWVGVGEDLLLGIAEDEGAKFGSFGFAGTGGLDEFTRPHGEEISANE
jgi:hypothetical protein